MMETPQQPPQQPIYPRELNLALDRNFAKFASYTDARFEQLAAHMRIGFEEFRMRDTALANSIRIGQEESLARDNDLANSMRSLADALLKLTERVSNLETTQNAIIKKLDVMEQQISEGFAAQAERLNELMVRVNKLEQKG